MTRQNVQAMRQLEAGRDGQAHRRRPGGRGDRALLRQHDFRLDPRGAVRRLDRLQRPALVQAVRPLSLHVPHPDRVAGGDLSVDVHPDQPELRHADQRAAQPAGPADQPAGRAGEHQGAADPGAHRQEGGRSSRATIPQVRALEEATRPESLVEQIEEAYREETGKPRRPENPRQGPVRFGSRAPRTLVT